MVAREGSPQVVAAREVVDSERKFTFAPFHQRLGWRDAVGESAEDWAGRETYPTKGDVKVVTASDMRCHFFAGAPRGIRTYDEAKVQ